MASVAGLRLGDTSGDLINTLDRERSDIAISVCSR